MVVIRKQSVKLLPKLAFYRVRMVRHYLPVVKHKQWLWPLLVPVKMSRSLMRWLAKAGQTSCCITIFHLIRWVRLAGWARRVAARLVMASWHGVRCVRYCRKRMNFLIPFGWCQKSLNQMDHHQWRPYVAVRWL